MKTIRRRILHWLFFTCAALTTAVALFYAEEDWRGARDWAAARRELLARGETLDFHDLLPPPVADDQNLAMAPLFVRVFQYEIDPRTHVLTFNRGSSWYLSAAYKQLQEMPWGREKDYVHHGPEAYGNWMTGHPSDLSVVQRYFRQRPEFPHPGQPQGPAAEVLLALTRYTPVLDELARDEAERPQTRFPVNWTLRPSWGIALPHYAFFQSLGATLRLRAVAELAAGQTAAARGDIMQMLHLRRAIEGDPIVIAPLVDSTFLRVLLQPVWEGLAARQWSAEDLDALRDVLRGINVLREFQQSMRGDRAFDAACWPEDLQDTAQAQELARIVPIMSDQQIGTSAYSPERLLWHALPYWPRGWYEQNAAIASRYIQEHWVDTVNPAEHRVAVAKIKSNERALQTLALTPKTILAKVSLEVFTSIITKFAQTQTTLDQAVTACALEKYYLDHHTYPATLAALVPAYLERVPSDVIDGAPMRYRLTVDGRYQLYSIGWDGHDDGGAIAWAPDAWRAAGPPAPGMERKLPGPARDGGDWVWQYAPADPPAPPARDSRLASRSEAAP